MQKWEYRVEECLGDYQLDKLGEQGWELVAVTSNDSGSPLKFYFKRPKD